MRTADPRIDAYIAKALPFAKPIFKHLRALVHKACPDVQETMRWSFPHFDYKGMLCSMAAFKQHCAFGFWKEKLILGTNPGLQGGMGSFGRITAIADLPGRRQLIALIKKAMKLNEKGIKLRRVKPFAKEALRVPPFVRAALKKNKKALEHFERFPPSHRREYLEWILVAKREETRQKQLATAVEWLAKGKQRNWKYIRK